METSSHQAEHGFLHRRTIAGVIGASLLLSGCSQSQSMASYRHDEFRKPIERYYFDFNDVDMSTVGHNSDCLLDTPYKYTDVIAIKDGSDGVKVLPKASGLQPLIFEHLGDIHAPLQAADPYTVEVLSSYDCPTTADGARKGVENGF